LEVAIIQRNTINEVIRGIELVSYKYSLFVNGKSLGPYERRMIVGMRVKKIVSDDQTVFRDDGLDMTVAQLLKDRDEAARHPNTGRDSHQESVLGAPSSGMWPQFNVRFGGGPIKAGALGFNGGGQISYQGDMLSVRGNRRNKNLGMSKQEDKLPTNAIESSVLDGTVVEILLKPGLSYRESIEGIPARLECATEDEAAELWELLNMAPGNMPRGLSYAKTGTGELL
jgi:hypothetical protein